MTIIVNHVLARVLPFIANTRCVIFRIWYKNNTCLYYMLRGRIQRIPSTVLLSLQVACRCMGLCRGDWQWHLKRWKRCHISPKSIAAEEVPTYIKTYQSQEDDASRLEVMLRTPLTVLLPPGKNCVTVYPCPDEVVRTIISPCTPRFASTWGSHI